MDQIETVHKHVFPSKITFNLFLFYLQSFFVVLLSPCDLDPTMKMLLQAPIWSQRVIYIQGSAVKDTDLARCR